MVLGLDQLTMQIADETVASSISWLEQLFFDTVCAIYDYSGFSGGRLGAWGGALLYSLCSRFLRIWAELQHSNCCSVSKDLSKDVIFNTCKLLGS